MGFTKASAPEAHAAGYNVVPGCFAVESDINVVMGVAGPRIVGKAFMLDKAL